MTRAQQPAVFDILLIGCGNMGSALLGGWLDRGIPASAVTVVEPDEARAAAAHARGVKVLRSLDPAAGGQPDVVVLAVKPQMIQHAVGGPVPLGAGDAVVLSVAAGKTISRLNALLGAPVAVVRAMPNTPAAIRQGITVACAGDTVSDVQRARCDALLAAVGSVLWVEDERLLDAVTAVSGSGPAYVFLLAESLAAAGVAAGLPQALAEQLARETVAGAGALLANTSEPASALRRNVTSPGGTTAAALAVLMAEEGGLPQLLHAAVQAATRRSAELAD